MFIYRCIQQSGRKSKGIPSERFQKMLQISGDMLIHLFLFPKIKNKYKFINLFKNKLTKNNHLITLKIKNKK